MRIFCPQRHPARGVQYQSEGLLRGRTGLTFPYCNFSKHGCWHWFSVMGMAKCRRLAGKPSACGYIIIDSIHPQMRSMPWNCYRSSAPHATLLSCNLIRRIPPSIMVAVSFTNVRTVLPTFLRPKFCAKFQIPSN